MSELLGPLLGMSPCFGLGAVGSSANFPGLAQYGRCPYCGGPSSSNPALNALIVPPLPEPGIHWTRTGGKSWRVVIVR
jgi:hypothetical protein